MSRARERGWMRTLAAAEDPAVRLVCFPHSGASASAFHGWTAALPPGVELVGVQYPGRGDRFGEQLVDDVAEMAGRVVAELLRLPAAEHVLFGHSLGALVAYETAMLLRDMGCEPHRLCASACLPPGGMKNRDVHLAPDDEFWETLAALGGIDPGIIKNAEMRELFTPTLRSDLRAHAEYRPRAGTTPLSCPVSCFHGDGDPLVDEDRMSGWAAVTSGAYTLRVRPGGHFHIFGDIAGLVADVLGRATV